MAAFHSSPHCGLCSVPKAENYQHSLFSCLSKLSVWRSIVHNFHFFGTLNDTAIINIFLQTTNLNLKQDLRDSSLPFPSLYLSNIYLYFVHYSSCSLENCFELSPFVSSNVFTSTTLSLSHLDAEFQPDLYIFQFYLFKNKLFLYSYICSIMCYLPTCHCPPQCHSDLGLLLYVSYKCILL